MTTYDVHQHLWPEAFVAALRLRRTPPLLDGAELETREGRFVVDLAEHGPDSRLRALDRDGIDVAVLSLQPSLALDELAPDERGALEGAWIEGARERSEERRVGKECALLCRSRWSPYH